MAPKPKKGAAPVQTTPSVKGLTVTGCSFMPATRALCAFLDFNQVKYDFNEVNVFEATSLHSNCNAGQPKLLKDGKVIMGDPASLFKFVSMCKGLQSKAGGPVELAEGFLAGKQRLLADSFLEYVQNMVNRTSSRLTKLVFQRLVYLQRKADPTNEQELENEIEMNLFDPKSNESLIAEESNIFLDVILANLQAQLVAENKLTGFESYNDELLSTLLTQGKAVAKPVVEKPISILGGQAVSSADLLMQAHVQNIVDVLNLKRIKEGEEVLDLQQATSGKYPAVASWLDNL